MIRKTRFKWVHKKFKNFLYNFFSKKFKFKYRSQIRICSLLKKKTFSVFIQDIKFFEESLYFYVMTKPLEAMNCFEFIINKLIKSFIFNDLHEEKIIKTIQLFLISSEKPKIFKQLTSKNLDKLITLKIKVFSVSQIRIKIGVIREPFSQNKIQETIFVNSKILGGKVLEKFSEKSNNSNQKIILTQTDFVDYQIIKAKDSLEKNVSDINYGYFYLIIEREMVGKVFPGKLLEITGVYMTNNFFLRKKESTFNKKVIIHVLGFQKCHENLKINFLKKDLVFDEDFLKFIKSKSLYNWIIASICPDILGFNQIKAGLAALLFGRNENNFITENPFFGDISMLIIGNNSNIKLNLFSFIKKIKGNLFNDFYSQTTLKEFKTTPKTDTSVNFLPYKSEGDAGKKKILCIDDLDKISPFEIHEIFNYSKKNSSILYNNKKKATTKQKGISFLAGIDEKQFKKVLMIPREKGNITLSFLSKFDLIFQLKERLNNNLEKRFARYFFKSQSQNKNLSLEFYELNRISFEMLKKYVRFASKNSHSILSENALQVLRNAYLYMRLCVKKKKEKNNHSFFEISIYHLESLIKISEAFGKMKMAKKITSQEVLEAVRLFQKRFFL